MKKHSERPRGPSDERNGVSYLSGQSGAYHLGMSGGVVEAPGVVVSELIGVHVSGTFYRGTIKPECQIPFRSRPYDQLLHIVSGTAIGICDGQVVGLIAGDTLHVAPHTAHELVNNGNDELEFLVVRFPAPKRRNWLQRLIGCY